VAAGQPVTITVTNVPAAPGLAATGIPAAPLAALAGILIIGGFVLLHAGRSGAS
jgi:hypothetical protein